MKESRDECATCLQEASEGTPVPCSHVIAGLCVYRSLKCNEDGAFGCRSNLTGRRLTESRKPRSASRSLERAKSDDESNEKKLAEASLDTPHPIHPTHLTTLPVKSLHNESSNVLGSTQMDITMNDGTALSRRY